MTNASPCSPASTDSNQAAKTSRARDEGGFVLISVIVAMIPVALAVGMFVTTMNGRVSRLNADLSQERAMMLAESGVDHAIFVANQMGLTHKMSYMRQLGVDESFLVEATHLLVDGLDNDGNGMVDDPDEDVFQVVVSGTCQDTTRRVAAYLGPTPMLPPITSAVSIVNPTTNLDLNGNGMIVGYDYNLLGLWTGGALPAITIASPGTLADLSAQITGGKESGNVVGSGGLPSVGTTVAMDVPTMMAALENAAGMVLTSKTYAKVTMGTVAKPEITYKKGDVHLSGNATGAGILVVEGSLRITGNFRYNGIVIVNGELNNGAGNAEIFGSLVMGPDATDLNYRGNGTVRYSTEGVDLAKSLTGIYTSFNGWQELAR